MCCFFWTSRVNISEYFSHLFSVGIFFDIIIIIMYTHNKHQISVLYSIFCTALKVAFARYTFLYTVYECHTQSVTSIRSKTLTNFLHKPWTDQVHFSVKNYRFSQKKKFIKIDLQLMNRSLISRMLFMFWLKGRSTVFMFL